MVKLSPLDKSDTRQYNFNLGVMSTVPSKIKITVVSDLHLEFSDIALTNAQGADVLILSGDIMIAQDLHDHPDIGHSETQEAIKSNANLGRRQERAYRFRQFLSRCASEFPHVIYVAGNHEFYHGKWFSSIDDLRNECAKFSNVHYLECNSVEINETMFVGGTLWTNLHKGDPMTMHAVADMMNDYRCIRNDHREYSKLRPANTIERHRKTLDYIREVVLNTREKYGKDARVVVVGHHAPTTLSRHPSFANDYLMNGAYHSDLSEFILDHPEIIMWTHGHVHDCFDYTVGTCRVVCNPRGYEHDGYSEFTNWNPNLLIEL